MLAGATLYVGFATHDLMKARLSEPLNFLTLASFLQAAVFVALSPVAGPAKLGEATAQTSAKAIKIRAVDFIKPLPRAQIRKPCCVLPDAANAGPTPQKTAYDWVIIGL